MKLAIITIYHVPNYGSVLQTYATQKLLEQLGHECRIIQYDYLNSPLQNSSLKKKLKSRVRDFVFFSKQGRLYSFRKKFLNYTKKFKTFKELSLFDWTQYDAFVVGSDQVWNTQFMYGDPAFLLSFVPPTKARYSLSSSFALDELPIPYVSLYKKELSRFRAISVREGNGVKIINKQLGIRCQVKVTLDPTLLLSREVWRDLIPRSKFEFMYHPYILFYLWNYAFEPRPYMLRVAEYFKKKMNCDIRVLEGHKYVQDLNTTWLDNNRSSIPEFIDLFSNASLVITSSFHGTAFAINFKRPLVSIVPDNKGDDRQTTLLNSVGLNSCIVKVNTPIENINPFYDEERVQFLLNKIREDNLEWIRNNFK